MFLCSITVIIVLFRSVLTQPVQKWTISRAPTDPMMLDFHHTRYYGGCFDVMSSGYEFNTVVQFIQNFDLVVSGCLINWNDPRHSIAINSCVWEFIGRNATPHKMVRFHAHSDYRHHRYFLDHILPAHEAAYLAGRHPGIILHSGGGDGSIITPVMDEVLSKKSIKRWIIEQNTIPELIDNPKVIMLPVGVCAREDVGPLGKILRTAVADTTSAADQRRRLLRQRHNDTRSDTIGSKDIAIVAHSSSAASVAASTTNQSALVTQAARPNPVPTQHKSHYHRLLKDSIRRAFPWKDRKDRILICYSDNGNENRIKYTQFAKSKCTVCDVCNGPQTPSDMWHRYGKYRYIFSPWGNGRDCGRSWEIMLMGAVPVIDYFPGALGYEKAGLSVAMVHAPEDLNEQNIAAWNARFHGQNATRLSYDYWKERLFEEASLQ